VPEIDSAEKRRGFEIQVSKFQFFKVSRLNLDAEIIRNVETLKLRNFVSVERKRGP
jgi:hypothetical protein